MEKIMSYVCKHMHLVERDIDNIVKILLKQHRFNKSMTALGVVTALYIVNLNYRLDNRNKNIHVLAKEVEELKETKGD